MPVFRVAGVTSSGQRFAVRCEAPAERNVRALLASEGAVADRVRKLPLSAWPLSMTRAPWLILVFPVFGYLLYLALAQGVLAGLDLRRAPLNRAAYERLEREGSEVAGTVTGRRRETARGWRQEVVEYAFAGPDGRERRGTLAAFPGDAAAGRHDLRLLGGEPPAVGAALVVTCLADEPRWHAPFRVDASLRARLAGLEGELQRRLAVLAAVALASAYMVYNFVLRTGSHYVLSPASPRLVLITAGANPFCPPDEDDGEDEDDEA